MKLIHRISSSIGSHFRIWLPLSLATATLIALLGPYAQLSTQFGEAILFDTHAAATVSDANQRIATLGPSGITLYQQGLLLDLLFAAANAVLLILWLRPATLPNTRPPFRYFLLLPILAFTADLVENLFIASYLTDSISTTTIAAGQAATTFKFACFLTAAAAGLILWLSRTLARIRHCRSA